MSNKVKENMYHKGDFLVSSLPCDCFHRNKDALLRQFRDVTRLLKTIRSSFLILVDISKFQNPGVNSKMITIGVAVYQSTVYI